MIVMSRLLLSTIIIILLKQANAYEHLYAFILFWIMSFPINS